MKPTEVEEDDSAIGAMCKDVFGEGFGRFLIAHMSTSDKIGVELFKWPDTVKPKNNLEYRKSRIFHFCVQEPEIERRSRRSWPTGAPSACPVNFHSNGFAILS